MLLTFEQYISTILESSKIVDYNKSQKLLDVDLDLVKLPSKFDEYQIKRTANNFYNSVGDFLKLLQNNVESLVEIYSDKIFNDYDDRFINSYILDNLSDYGKSLYKTNKKFKSSIDGLRKLVESSKSFKALRKLSLEKGMTIDAIVYASAWIEYFTRMSGRKLPKESYPYIQKLTVENLPKTIYRGFYFDGAKISNVEKFLKLWSVGNKPMQKLKKVTSWTTSLNVASYFTIPDDNVKDSENGFAIILKATPTKANTIADLRNYEKGSYYSQMEVIMDENFLDYEVFMVKKGSQIFNNEIKSTDLFGSYSGSFADKPKRDVLRNPFGYWSFKGFDAERETLKTFVNLTPIEIENKQLGYYKEDFLPNFRNENLIKFWELFSISTGAFLKECFKTEIDFLEIIDKNTVKFKANFNISSLIPIKEIPKDLIYSINHNEDFYYTASVSVSATPLAINISATIQNVSFEPTDKRFDEIRKYTNLENFKTYLNDYFKNLFNRYKIVKINIL